ncbi:MAG: leucyl aminopeptidase family protein, partial [Gammaproteobacteria bacterium]|nr:leucyl aminopeptidase family protein [Gammaproteobacteria bacterium]
MKCLIPKTANSRPLFPVDAANLPHWLASRDAATRRFLLGCGFDASAGSLCALPGGDGHPSGFAFGFDPQDPWSLAVLPDKLPPGNYHLQGGAIPADSMALAWYLACYRFDRYRQPVKNRAERKPPCLVTERVVRQRVEPIAEAICLTRDLINTPAEDMLPRHLAQVVAKLAADFGGGFSETVGKQLLRSNFPSIHAVGRASADEPRLLDLRWGDARAPRITLVGKGVCFDTGGLDLKPSRFMRMMKKDMGGAAHAIGLARWIMHTRLPVRLRLLIPAVENAVSGNALRPGDVIASRKGLS